MFLAQHLHTIIDGGILAALALLAAMGVEAVVTDGSL